MSPEDQKRMSLDRCQGWPSTAATTGGNGPLGAYGPPARPAGRRSDRYWQQAGPRDESSPDKTGTSMAAPAALCLTFSWPWVGGRALNAAKQSQNQNGSQASCRSWLATHTRMQHFDKDALRAISTSNNAREKEINLQALESHRAGFGLNNRPARSRGRKPDRTKTMKED